MEQKEVVHRYLMTGGRTLDKVLQVLNHLRLDGIVRLKDSQFPLHGETNLYKLNNRSDPLTSVFLNEKVNLNKLKERLGEQGIPFSFNETKDGTQLFFRIKDKELAKIGLERVITDIKKNPKAILKRPNAMTFEEKVAYVRQSKTFKGAIEPKNTISKGRGI